jgi:hypothetical protein
MRFASRSQKFAARRALVPSARREPLRRYGYARFAGRDFRVDWRSAPPASREKVLGWSLPALLRELCWPHTSVETSTNWRRKLGMTRFLPSHRQNGQASIAHGQKSYGITRQASIRGVRLTKPISTFPTLTRDLCQFITCTKTQKLT